MKRSLLIAAVASCGLLSTNLFAEEVTTTTTTTETSGVVSELGSGALIVKSESDPSPLSYGYTKTTTYVDEAGNPVAMETVKSGVPVTVYYTKSPDGLVASRVVVRKTTTGDPVHRKTTIKEERTTIER